MIVYEFPLDEFNAREGYAQIAVRDGKLELQHEPDELLLSLIMKYGGKLAEDKPAAKQTKVETKTAAKAEAKTKDGE